MKIKLANNRRYYINATVFFGQQGERIDPFLLVRHMLLIFSAFKMERM